MNIKTKNMQNNEDEYYSEAGLKLYLGPYRICQFDEFEELERASERGELKIYNIYFICQRNRIAINSNHIEIKDNLIDLEFEIYDEKEKYVVSYGIDNSFKSKKLSINSTYPYNFFELINEKNEIVYHHKSAYVLENSLPEDSRFRIYPRPSFLDFEILYIGQSMRNSDKPVIDRLKKRHKTLKKILDFNYNNPNKEIYFVLCSFVMDGVIEIKGSVNKEEGQRLENFINSGLKLTPKQETTLTEAALIKYFEPIYNIHYKHSFPKKQNKSYNECYKLDLNDVSIGLDSELYFFSKKIKTDKIHYMNYPFKEDTDRRKLFDL